MLHVTCIRIAQGQYRWRGTGESLPLGEVEVDWQDSLLRTGTLRVDLSGARPDYPLRTELAEFLRAVDRWLTTQIHETPA